MIVDNEYVVDLTSDGFCYQIKTCYNIRTVVPTVIAARCKCHTSFAYGLQFVERAARWEPKTANWHETTRFIISWMRGRPIFSIVWYSAAVNPLPKRLIAAFGGTIGIVKNQAYPSVALVSRAVTLTNRYDWSSHSLEIWAPEYDYVQSRVSRLQGALVWCHTHMWWYSALAYDVWLYSAPSYDVLRFCNCTRALCRQVF